jgi:hypothetical protein
MFQCNTRNLFFFYLSEPLLRACIVCGPNYVGCPESFARGLVSQRLAIWPQHKGNGPNSDVPRNRGKKVCANWLVGYRVMSLFLRCIKTTGKRKLHSRDQRIGTVLTRHRNRATLWNFPCEHGIYQPLLTSRISVQTNACSKCFTIPVFYLFS